MKVLFTAVLSGTETPMPTPSMTVDPDAVTPGPAGFAVIVLIVVVVALLIWDMNRRVRRVRYRAEVREELDAEQAAEHAASGTTGPDAASETDAGGETPSDQKGPPA